MDDSLHAARQGDLILHPPLMAELVSTLTEAVVYAAATAAVAAAIGGAVVAVVGTGGAAAALTPLIAGALVGAAAMLPGGEDKSIGDQISDFSSWVGNSMFPPEPYGAIETGSSNTHINGIPAARAAGTVTGISEPEAAAEEPSILENIGSYAMMGASMMLPIIGLAQEIDSIFNPPVTTPRDPGTQPAELDTVKCSKHPTPNFVAQGSDKVFINGHPAARVGDKSTCDGPIGMTFSPNVRIGGGTLTVQDIHDGKSAAAKIIGIVAGMLLSRRGGKARPRPNKSPKPRPKVRSCRGHPVVVSSGAKLLEGSDDLDFSLPGLLPIVWARRYDSGDRRSDGLFGQGWSVPYEVSIERVDHPHGGDLWVYVDEEGTRIELGRIEVGSAFVSSLDGLAFFHQEHGVTVVENIYSGLYQVFKTDPGNARRSRLVQLGDRNLNRLDVLYDDRGRLQYLVDTFGRTAVELRHAPEHPRRVSEVRRLYLQPGNTFAVARDEMLVSYGHSASGQLSEVRDAAGRVLRRFDYTGEGLMCSHALASGAVFHYQWQRFDADTRQAEGLPPLLEPQPQHEWRVVQHWSDDGEHYRFTYDLQRGHTLVTDSLARVEHFEWGPLHEVTRHVDALGQQWQEDVVQGQLICSIDPQGARWSYRYDALGRLIAIEDPLGRCEHIAYLDHWALPTQVSDRAGNITRHAYDSHGNLIRRTNALGHSTHYAYDPQGRLVRSEDAQGKARHLQWNDRGQLRSYRDCSGQLTRYNYDDRGHLSVTRDALGNRTGYSFDERGLLLQRQSPDGRVDHYLYDQAGHLVRHVDPAQQVTHWQYDDRGRFSHRIDAMGLEQRVIWDSYDRPLELHNENQESYRLQWDALDRLEGQRNLDGSSQRYHYDAGGNIVRHDLYPALYSEPPLVGDQPEPEPAPQTRYLTYDAAGRLGSKTTADGVTRYGYDKLDNLQAIDFTGTDGVQQRLDMRHDALGRLMSETCGTGELQYAYDELGNLQTLTLPDQRRLNHLYYGAGHLHQLNLDGKVICDFERDELHREVLRTQGKLRTRTRYDSNARMIQQALQYHDASLVGLALLQKDYEYDSADNLIGEVFTQTQRPGTGLGNDVDHIIGRLHGTAGGSASHQGRTRYDYGPTERIHGASRQMPLQDGLAVEHYGYDKPGNLLDGFSFGEQPQHNRVKVYQDKRYRYDGFGRLCEKHTGRHLVQRFEYDAEHRLVCVHQQRGPARERVVFIYDPLGRRTHKYLYRNEHPAPISQTRFLWQGMRLLQEIDNGRLSLHLYTDSTGYEPLARIDGGPGQERLHYFHTSPAGLPEQLTDEHGLGVWHSAYQVWGNSRDEWHDPKTSGQQNLRYQGQYLDRETGLHYNTLRYYDPDIGRFTSPDPIGLAGGLNLYRYAANPFAWRDPLGLEVCDMDAKGWESKGPAPTGMINPHMHHTVRENAPSNWGQDGRDAILESQRMADWAGMSNINKDRRNFDWAQNGAGNHSKAAAMAVRDAMKAAVPQGKEAVISAIEKMSERFKNNQVVRRNAKGAWEAYPIDDL